jgi:glycosyltransferase involved in cell wall biosynthesis
MNKPLVSIILPVFNGEKYLYEAVTSCLAQTYRNIELLIIDDCSTDNTFRIAREFKEKDCRVKLFSNSENKKLPASLNIGHQLANGKYLTWTSHDNILHQEAIENLCLHILEQKVDVVYSSYLIIDAKGALKGSHRLKEIEYSFFYGVIGACFIYSREFFFKNGEYDENLYLLEDFDFWLRGLKHGKFYRIDNPGFYLYRYHADALTAKINIDISMKKEFERKLHQCYQKIFKDEKSKELNSDLIKYFESYLINDLDAKMLPLRSKTFFKELEDKIKLYRGVSYIKLKRIIIQDCVELILKNRRYQKLSFLVYLHLNARAELLRLPVERYLVLCKKCMVK